MTTETRAPSVARTTAGPVAQARLHRLRVEAAAAVLLVGAGELSGVPVLVLLGLAVAVAVQLRRWLPADVAVPTAVGCLVAAAVAIGITSHLAGVDVLTDPWVVGGIYLGACAAGLWGAPTDASTGRATYGSSWLVALGRLPAAVAAAVGLAQSFAPSLVASWAYRGTDLVTHAGLVATLQETGRLDYVASGYPQGFHMLAALVSVPTAPVGDRAALLTYDAALVAGCAWLALALVLWTASAVIARVGARVGLPPVARAVASLGLGVALLSSSSFVLMFVFLGAVPSLLAMVALWALPLAVLASADSAGTQRSPLLAASGALLLLSQLWQPLVLAPLVVAAVLLGRRAVDLARGRRTTRGGRRQVLAGVLAICVLLFVVELPVVGVLRSGGLTLASQPGAVPELPWAALVFAVAALALVAWQLRDTVALTFAASAAGLVVAAAVLLVGAGGSLDVRQYYPMKTLWFLLVLLAPLAAVAHAQVATMFWRGAWRYLVVGAFVVAAACILSVHDPDLQAVGVGSDGRSQTRLDTAIYAASLAPAVAIPYKTGAPGDPVDARTVARIATFLTGSSSFTGADANVCADVAVQGQTQRVVVVTRRDPAAVRARLVALGCPAEVDVRRVPR